MSTVDAGGRYEYVVSPQAELGELYSMVSEKLDDMVLLMKKGSEPAMCYQPCSRYIETK
ncbi:MAG: hypothetical protein QW453_03445 [Thermoprotei archaeon]|uniref:hypothetical protein n=1 Tax=Desulfurococcus sp. TaxID=51678 RepID=UPI003160BB3E